MSKGRQRRRVSSCLLATCRRHKRCWGVAVPLHAESASIKFEKLETLRADGELTLSRGTWGPGRSPALLGYQFRVAACAGIVVVAARVGTPSATAHPPTRPAK
jgi:hypothetical protein